MNKDTTAMQDIVLYLRQVRTENAKERDLALKRAWEKATELLKKEKEQILDAFVAGDERGTKEIPFNAEQYYNQTYNN